MKRVFAMIMLAAGLLSCVKENLIPAEEHDESAGIPVSFNIGVAETKAAKTGWAEGDVIYVFFNGIGKKYVKLELSDGRWTSKVTGGIFERDDFSSLKEKKLTAVHFPVGVKVEYEIGLQQFSFSKGGAPLYNYYLYEGGKSYALDVTQEGVTVSATLSLRKPAGMVQIHVAGIQENVADYTFGCSLIRPEALTGVSKSSGGLVKKELQAGARLSGIADSDGAIFAGRLESPGVAANYKFTLASDTHLYTLTRPDRKLEAGKMYNFPAPSVTGGNNWTATAASELYVDLGLSVKWAKCNLGAATEMEAGDYFAWGELQPKADFSWDTYLWGNGSSFSKYTGSDYTVLQKEDDAAYAALGGKWRMPTEAEIEALREVFMNEDPLAPIIFYPGWSKPTHVVLKNQEYGFELTLPFSGRKNGATVTESGNKGYFWSSSLRLDNSKPYLTSIVLGGVTVTCYSDDRYYGQPVRPVWSE